MAKLSPHYAQRAPANCIIDVGVMAASSSNSSRAGQQSSALSDAAGSAHRALRRFQFEHAAVKSQRVDRVVTIS
jgi:hypothetical protein